ncbi:MAG TPA: hypothetical protein VFU19_20005 [Iamia sp.]|nr:hypothetical protein [Iamia sp.]
MPRPTDLPFGHAAAAVAVAALDRAAAVLADVDDGRAGAGATARRHFAGVYAGDFDRADRDLGTATADARASVAALRAAVAGAAAAARRAQAARAEEQRAWDAEHAQPPPVGRR